MKNMMSGTSKRLLVVDDEPTIRRVLQRALRSAGYEVITAADGREALEIIFQEDIAVVLLDIMMPGISGLEVLRQLAANRPDVCVIMMTAVVETEIVAAALKLGACDYIIKPFERDQVVVSVSRALEKRRLSQENKEYHGGK